ncbi:MAG: (d)CMP kinase [SAR324 cluster bacterium]|nr:(d)CMP kinase [SAR324 cluster bacterium]
MKFIVVAIDGPTGVGKSTITKLLAKNKQLMYVDTGAMYRCLAWKWEQYGCLEEINILDKIANETVIEFQDSGEIFCDGENVTETIRSEKISALASKISQFLQIRSSMKNQQRRLVHNMRNHSQFNGAVLEGRDIGTVVFPDADVKFFVDADASVRAKRRYDQLSQKGINANFQEILDALQLRDKQDVSREFAPLTKANDAIVIDTTHLSIDEVIHQMMFHIDKLSLIKS